MVFFLTALLVIAGDQLTKLGIRSYPTGQPILAIKFFRLVHSQNTGAAFGLFQGHSFTLTIVALVAIAVILAYILLFSHRFPLLNNWLGQLALGLVFGGTMGNLIDRLRWGYVTDFIDIGVWPTFNLADSAITVGIILVAYSLLFLTRPERR